jgi:hypothetical protein
MQERWQIRKALLSYTFVFHREAHTPPVIYSLLRFAHLVGLTRMGAGLIGVWISELRSRKVHDLALFAEAVRSIAVFYDGLVVPSAVILFASGTPG